MFLPSKGLTTPDSGSQKYSQAFPGGAKNRKSVHRVSWCHLHKLFSLNLLVPPAADLLLSPRSWEQRH